MTDTWVDEGAMMQAAAPRAGLPLAKDWEHRCRTMHATKMEYERLLDEWKGPSVKSQRNKIINERMNELIRKQTKATNDWADAVEKHYGKGTRFDWTPCLMDGGLWEFHCTVGGDLYRNTKEQRYSERV